MGKAIWLITEEKLEEIKNNKHYRVVEHSNSNMISILCSVCNHLVRRVTFDIRLSSNKKYLRTVNIYENEEY